MILQRTILILQCIIRHSPPIIWQPTQKLHLQFIQLFRSSNFFLPRRNNRPNILFTIKVFSFKDLPFSAGEEDAGLATQAGFAAEEFGEGGEGVCEPGVGF
jgi:hypothetical protein